MIYFDRALQDRVHELFYESLVTFGVLGARPQGVDPLQPARGRATRSSTPNEKLYRKIGERVRAGRASARRGAGCSAVGQRARRPARGVRRADRDRAASPARLAAGGARAAAAAHSSTPRARCRGQDADRAATTSTSRRPTITCSSSAGSFALSVDERDPVRAALDRRAVRNGRRRLRRRRDRDHPHGRERRRGARPRADQGARRRGYRPGSATARARRTMPRRAIAATVADAILPLEEIGKFVYGLCVQVGAAAARATEA